MFWWGKVWKIAKSGWFFTICFCWEGGHQSLWPGRGMPHAPFYIWPLFVLTSDPGRNAPFHPFVPTACLSIYGGGGGGSWMNMIGGSVCEMVWHRGKSNFAWKWMKIGHTLPTDINSDQMVFIPETNIPNFFLSQIHSRSIYWYWSIPLNNHPSKLYHFEKMRMDMMLRVELQRGAVEMLACL